LDFKKKAKLLELIRTALPDDSDAFLMDSTGRVVVHSGITAVLSLINDVGQTLFVSYSVPGKAWIFFILCVFCWQRPNGGRIELSNQSYAQHVATCESAQKLLKVAGFRLNEQGNAWQLIHHNAAILNLVSEVSWSNFFWCVL
jgi:hypothetical protein